MANRNLKRDRGALTRGLVDIYASVAIGGTGAPTLSTTLSEGVSTVARNSAGNYTVTLQDRYNKGLKFLGFNFVKSSGAPATTANPAPIVRTDNSNASSKQIVIEFLDSTGAAIEVASGVTLLLKFTLKNSM